MKCGKDYFKEGKSSFLSVEKDLSQITEKILKNDKLLKLLYYTQPDCLKAPNLTQVEKMSLLNKQIRIIPKLNITTNCPIYIVITLGNFIPNETNPQFRDCVLSIDILCHPDHWNLGNFSLRPYRIAGELDSDLDEAQFSGIGKLQFMGGDNLVLNDDLMGLTLMYRAVHGIEDEINPLV